MVTDSAALTDLEKLRQASKPFNHGERVGPLPNSPEIRSASLRRRPARLIAIDQRYRRLIADSPMWPDLVVVSKPLRGAVQRTVLSRPLNASKRRAGRLSGP